MSQQVFTFSWREDIRPGDPQHTKKFCFDAISHSSPVTLYDCHGMKGNQLWRYRRVSVCCARVHTRVFIKVARCL